MLHFVNGSFPMLRWLPPSFAAKAILLTTRPMLAAGAFSGLLAWTIGFLAIFALRLHKQFLGEYLSEGPARQTPASARATRVLPIASGGSGSQAKPSLIPPAIAACLRKEYMYLRGNGSQLIGMLTPLLFVVILSRGLFAHHPAYLLPGSLGYVLFALLAGLYNIFGADGAGVQLYLMAPVRFRDVIFAKNLVSLSLILSEALLAWFVVLMVATAPIPASAQVSTWCWVVFVVAVNLTVGTLRSIQAPRKFVPGQVRQMRTPTNRTSSLLAVGILLGSILLQVPVMLLCRHLGRPWLATMIFGPLAAAAVMGYFVLLQFVDRMILAHRDVFAGELCGV
jgi:ABC-2 type transport system permease protein